MQKLYAKCPLVYECTCKKYRNTLTSVSRAAKKTYYNSAMMKTIIKSVSSEQVGFWEERECRDQIFRVRVIVGEYPTAGEAAVCCLHGPGESL